MGNKLKNPVLTKDTKNLLYKGSKHQSENKKKKEEIKKIKDKLAREIKQFQKKDKYPKPSKEETVKKAERHINKTTNKAETLLAFLIKTLTDFESKNGKYIIENIHKMKIVFNELLEAMTILETAPLINKQVKKGKEKLEIILDKINNNKIKKISELKTEIGDLINHLEKITFKKDKLKYINEASEVFKTLKEVKIPEDDVPYMILKAPIIFSTNKPINALVEKELNKTINLKPTGMFGYYYIKNAVLLVLQKGALYESLKERLGKAPKNSGNAIEEAEVLLNIINKRGINKGEVDYILIHNVSKSNNSYYVVWMVKKNNLNSVLDLSKENFQMLVKL